MTATSAEDILRALQTHSGEMLVVVSDDGLVGPVRTGASLLGWPAEEGEARHIAEMVHPDDLAHVLEFIDQVRSAPGMRASTIVRVRHRDGRWLPLEVDVIDARREPPLLGFVVRLHASGRADGRADQLRFMPLAEIVPFGILSADDQGAVVYANEAAAELFERRPEDLLGAGWLAALVEEDRARVASVIGAIRPDAEPTVTCRVNVGPPVRWLQGRFRLRIAHAGAGWVATFNDVTPERRLEAELAHQATHDSLTGLPNRALLYDRLDNTLARLDRRAGTVTVFFVDLDGFKPVNDQHGHAVGDALLEETARRLRQVVRLTDTASRFGGDEFVVVSEGLNAGEATRMARRIADAIAQPLTIGDQAVSITGCVGVSITDDAAQPAGELLDQADEAMYRAKRNGTTIELASGFDDSGD